MDVARCTRHPALTTDAVLAVTAFLRATSRADEAQQIMQAMALRNSGTLTGGAP